MDKKRRSGYKIGYTVRRRLTCKCGATTYIIGNTTGLLTIERPSYRCSECSKSDEEPKPRRKRKFVPRNEELQKLKQLREIGGERSH